MFNNQQITMVSKILKSISNENRLKILCVLLDGPTNVNDLVIKTNINQSALSQHLKILKEQNLINCNIKHKYYYYYISDHKIKNILLNLKESYCEV